MAIDSTRLVSSTSRDHAAIQKLQLKSSHPTLIIDLNEDDFDRCSQSSEICLEKFNYGPSSVDHIFWSDKCKFNGNGAINRHNCKLPTSLLMRNLVCQTQKKRSWCGVVYQQMNCLVLTFSMKQSRVQHDSGLCMVLITTQETVLST